MSIRGGCKCNNIQFVWHTVDRSLMPRACQCRYCLDKAAAYVSKSGTKVEVSIRKESLLVVRQQGSMEANFYECKFCEEVVFVSALVDGELYAALNSRCAADTSVFGEPVKMELFTQSASEKRQRWRENWCYPVYVNYGAG